MQGQSPVSQPPNKNSQRIVVFLSSPSDVQAERDRAKSVCAALQREPFIRENFQLDVRAYEDLVPPVIGAAPQRTVDTYAQLAEADVVIGILWSRMGTPLVDAAGERWESGTAYELGTAVRRYERTGTHPVVLLYRGRRAVPPATPAENAAHVDRYFNSFKEPSSGRRGLPPREFTTTDEFAEHLRDDLREVLQHYKPAKYTNPLDRLAEFVKTMWIGGILTPSLEGRPAIPLPIEGEPGHYTDVYLKSLFDQSERRLVFTGEQGAGKTTTLLQLLQFLLQDRRAGEPVPIVVDATSWRATQSIEEWICHELARLYQFKPKTASEFVENRQLIYLIDSLDQVGMQSREANDAHDGVDGDPNARLEFSQRLQEFMESLGWAPATRPGIVLCCREERLSEFTALFNAGAFQLVRLKPPELESILETVRSDAEVRGLAEKLRDYPHLQELAAKPLYLQMLMTVFRNAPATPDSSIWERGDTDALLRDYVVLRMHSPASTIPSDFTPRRVFPWLIWLARKQNRSPFLIELMDPSMLEDRERKWYRLLAASALSLGVMVLACLPVAVGLGIDWGSHDGGLVGLEIGVLSAAIILVFALISLVPSFLWARGPWLGLCLGLVFSAVRGFSVGMGGLEGVLPAGFDAGIRAAALTWVACTPVFVIYTFNNKYSLDAINPLTNWNVNLRRAWWCPMAGVAIGAVFWLLYGPARGITFGVVSGVVMTGFVCLQRSGFDVPDQPNQGIVRSRFNALVVTVFALLTFPPVVIVAYGAQFGWPAGLESGVEAAAVSIVALLFGGVPVLQHYSLRIVCARRGHLPLTRLVPFLNAMTEMMLVRRVGGAYQFSNDRIRAFFAAGAGWTATRGSRLRG
jgi:hypothetical protein